MFYHPVLHIWDNKSNEFWIFLNNLQDMSPFCGATDTHVLDFWWCLPWVSKPGGSLACVLPCLHVADSSDSSRMSASWHQHGSQLHSPHATYVAEVKFQDSIKTPPAQLSRHAIHLATSNGFKILEFLLVHPPSQTSFHEVKSRLVRTYV